MRFVEIKTPLNWLTIVLFVLLSSFSYSQTNSLDPELLKPNPAKEKMYLPYLAARHGGFDALETWKKSNTIQYYKELWYFCESFYIKRNHLSLSAGSVELNEEIIDISRFESSRKQNEEFVLVLPSFKDAIVLLPYTKLVYKPEYISKSE
ncbi:hypothetical protein [Aurantibacillus circumpalustris]|uniref:hypothetical protein n=1 Tax=Aurantibacillus circumpalustris TaxID=3036359 RepID=UPI00295AB6C0|nr:hypothetical protein [Aurantibacillus circumpalustris]